jgi:hypothetical protein
MVKSFLTYSAIIEGLTGVALILVPSRASLLLFETELNVSLEIVLAMVAGAAIFSLALGSWLARSGIASLMAVKMLLLYNIAVTLILLYAALGLGFKGIPLWLVIIFHSFQTVVGIVIIKKKLKEAI